MLMLMLNSLTIERSAKTRKPTEGSKRNEGVILAPKLDLRFLRLLAKAFGVGFCKNLCRLPVSKRILFEAHSTCFCLWDE
jgi:hypothetical protein